MDALGSTLALADAAGAVQTEYGYEPYGGTTQSGTGSPNPARFTGREEDGTGLYYYRARYYDPRRQRFVSEDPIGFAGGDLNLHAYVSGGPTNFNDPSGHLAPAAAMAVGCLIGAAASAGGDAMAGRKIDWPSAAAGCAMGAFGGFGRGAGAAAAAAARGAGRRGAANAGAKSAEKLAEHLQRLEAARKQLQDLIDRLNQAKGPKRRQPIQDLIDKLLEQIKGHEKEVNQKWPGQGR